MNTTFATATATTEINAVSALPVTTYEGMCAGLVRNNDMWYFEGLEYETPADEAAVLETVGEALSEPNDALVAAAGKLVFHNPQITYTSQVLIAMAAAYASECEGVEGVEPVVAILQEAARRIAVIEALTI